MRWRMAGFVRIFVLSFLLCLMIKTTSSHTITRIATEESDYRQFSVPVSVGSPITLQSVGYPSCCTPAKYSVSYNGERSIVGLQLVFEQLDVPPNSIIELYDGFTENSPPLVPHPRQTKYGWTRPFLTSSNSSMLIVFNPGTSGNRNYTGFKAIVSVNTAELQVDVPFTDCPQLGDPMDGGRIQLGTLDLSYKREQYSYDCVWQIKPSVEGWHVFLHIDSMDLSEDGMAFIHNGSYADSPTVNEYINDVSSRGSSDGDMGQPPGGFTSQNGFYIRVHKSLEHGHFNFTYGMYEEVPKSSGECELKIGKLVLSGYHCEASDRCILNTHRCNKIIECPNGDDEDQEYCSRPITTTAPTTTACPTKLCDNGRCVPNDWSCPEDESSSCDLFVYKLCPDGSCISSLARCPGECQPHEKECSGGSCVESIYGRCPGRCSFMEKQCLDRSCVSLGSRCPSDACPSYKPNRCTYDNICYYNSDKCDGSTICSDGSDEENCQLSHSGIFSLKRSMFISSIFVTLCGALCCCVARLWCKTKLDEYSLDTKGPKRSMNPVTKGMLIFLGVALLFCGSIACYVGIVCCRNQCEKNASDPQPPVSAENMKLLLIVMVPIILFVGICVILRRYRSRHHSTAQPSDATPMQPITSGTHPGSTPQPAMAGHHYNFAEPANNGSGYAPGVPPGPDAPPIFVADAPPPSYDEVVNPSAPHPPPPQPEQGALPSYTDVISGATNV